MKAALLDITKTFLIYIILCIATFLMLRTVVSYASFQDDVAFLSQKQDYLHLTIWKVSFYIHVFSSILCLIAGFTQFSNDILKNQINLHRVVGKIYVFNILIINFPVALIMAYYANGFIPTKIAFLILDTLWFWFTLKAFLEIKKGNTQKHKEYMIRSYALTFSAITLRTLKLVLSNVTDIEPMTLYMMNAWLAFIPNLIIAELIIRYKRKLN